MRKRVTSISTIALFFLVVATVYINLSKQKAVDHSKLPQKVEDARGFQRWITNLKNKKLDFIDADQFRLLEENEIYNTKWIKIYSIEEEGREEEFNTTIETHKDVEHVVFSPSERIFIDYRNEVRDEYEPNEAHLYGLRDDKIIDARILDCSLRANCYFDRAYFLDNDVFVISEISRNLDKKAEDIPPCSITQECTYTFKIHVIDLINNKRWVYESKPFDIVLEEVLPEL